MKKSVLRILRYFGVLVSSSFALMSLCQCSLFGGGLLTSSEDGDAYGGNALSLDADGLNYAATATSFDIATLGENNDSIELPATGTQNLLVIPVEFDDYSRLATSSVRNDIYTTFFGNPEDTGWESLASFYYKSSFQRLLLQGSVSDWYDCGYTTSQFAKLPLSYTGEYADHYEPTWTLLESAVAWYKRTYGTNCASFDNNHDGLLDGVWLVYGCPYYNPFNGLSDDFWAYTYYDYSLIGQPLSLGDPMAYHYCWASYKFMYEMEDSWGAGKLDCHTFVHETGHLMGLDDYYVAGSDATNAAPMGFVDMMDANVIDHDVYSKFNFGWVKPYLVSGDCSIVLKPSASTGQCVLLPTGDGWNGSFADEYLLLEYYTPTGLNERDAETTYANGIRGFTENGVRIYHVDSRMIAVTGLGSVEGYVDRFPSSGYARLAHSNSNDRNQINSDYRLIQELDCTKKRNFDEFQANKKVAVADGSTLFQEGDSFSFASYQDSFPRLGLMNDGSTMPYQIAFSDMSDESITLTISRA
ncbi:MAG: hypothetical protein LKK13_02040 [Bacilli bacterium]|jgi:M6 family metalloprotease-like protein|nr:hypothetical protein [Bacilli bacterium]